MCPNCKFCNMIWYKRTTLIFQNRDSILFQHHHQDHNLTNMRHTLLKIKTARSYWHILKLCKTKSPVGESHHCEAQTEATYSGIHIFRYGYGGDFVCEMYSEAFYFSKRVLIALEISQQVHYSISVFSVYRLTITHTHQRTWVICNRLV